MHLHYGNAKDKYSKDRYRRSDTVHNAESRKRKELRKDDPYKGVNRQGNGTVAWRDKYIFKSALTCRKTGDQPVCEWPENYKTGGT